MCLCSHYVKVIHEKHTRINKKQLGQLQSQHVKKLTCKTQPEGHGDSSVSYIAQTQKPGLMLLSHDPNSRKV